MNKEIDKLAKKIWDYHHMNQKLEKADVILVLGSNDVRIARYGADLFLKGFAPLIVFSGKRGRLTNTWPETEAKKFSKIAIGLGVPKNKILIEEESTNTSENILFTKKIFDEKNLNPKKMIVVQKPYMERRTYATFKKRWRGKNVIVSSPPILFEEYPNRVIPKELMISMMVGDLQRIKIYPKYGFQINQKIPQDVWEAYKELVRAGYTKHLIKDIAIKK